ncbi:hypothetical protein [Actinomadura keratinilytica]|uniref:hypothetical protein n=1 Tax=Actinomadura keratinilytica TaxID=547461 RepID=UPI003608182C
MNDRSSAPPPRGSRSDLPDLPDPLGPPAAAGPRGAAVADRPRQPRKPVRPLVRLLSRSADLVVRLAGAIRTPSGRRSPPTGCGPWWRPPPSSPTTSGR